MIAVDPEMCIEVMQPHSKERGVFLVRPLTYRGFMEIARREGEGVVEHVTLMADVCKLAIVGYRWEGQPREWSADDVAELPLPSIAAVFKAVIDLSRVSVEQAGK